MGQSESNSASAGLLCCKHHSVDDRTVSTSSNLARGIRNPPLEPVLSLFVRDPEDEKSEFSLKSAQNTTLLTSQLNKQILIATSKFQR